MLADQEQSLTATRPRSATATSHSTSISGHDTTYRRFRGGVVSGKHPGVVDGELICMVVDGNAVVILVAAQQGRSRLRSSTTFRRCSSA
jgi:hypothetical protein